MNSGHLIFDYVARNAINAVGGVMGDSDAVLDQVCVNIVQMPVCPNSQSASTRQSPHLASQQMLPALCLT